MRALMTQRDVLAYLGVGRQTLYEHRRRGSFPQPLLLGGKTARWLREEVELWTIRNVERHGGPAETWTIRDVLAYLAVSRGTLDSYLATAEFPPPIIGRGRVMRWLPKQVGEWALAQERGFAESRRRTLA